MPVHRFYACVCVLYIMCRAGFVLPEDVVQLFYGSGLMLLPEEAFARFCSKAVDVSLVLC